MTCALPQAWSTRRLATMSGDCQPPYAGGIRQCPPTYEPLVPGVATPPSAPAAPLKSMIWAVTTLFGRQSGREAAAELGGVAPHPPAAVAGIFLRQVAGAVEQRGCRVEVEERHRQTGREARPLHEGAVRAERAPSQALRCRCCCVRDADRDVAAGYAVSRLFASIGRDIAAFPRPEVVGVAVVIVRRSKSPWSSCR